MIFSLFLHYSCKNETQSGLRRSKDNETHPSFSQPSRQQVVNPTTTIKTRRIPRNNINNKKQQKEQLLKSGTDKMHQRRNGDCLVTNGAAAAAAPGPAPATATAKGTGAGATAARCGCYFSLACSIGSMGLACGSLWQIPNTTDRITLQRGLFLTSLGFIYFISLTDFCNKYFLETKRGQQFRQKYRLMISDVLEITNK